MFAPHDRLFKQLLSTPTAVAAVLTLILPQASLPALALEELTLRPSVLVTGPTELRADILDDVGADDDSVIVVPVGAHVKRQSGGISGYPTTLRASVGADRGREHRVGIQAGVI